MKKISLLAILALLVTLAGCGSGANNDEGVSFTFFGYFADVKGETGLSGSSFSLTEPSGSSYFGPTAFLGLQNNLSGQSIRLQRVNYTFNVPGAAAQPPSASEALPGLLSPTDDKNSQNTTLPPTVSGNAKAGPVQFTQVSLVPKSVRDWLRANRGLLPAAPFPLEASLSASGRTSSGDLLESNEDTIVVAVTD